MTPDQSGASAPADTNPEVGIDALREAADRLEKMRDEWLMATPDKNHTPWAIVTAAIDAMRRASLSDGDGLRARVRELERLLEPFSKAHEAVEGICADSYSGTIPDDQRVWCKADDEGGAYPLFTFGDLRRARAGRGGDLALGSVDAGVVS